MSLFHLLPAQKSYKHFKISGKIETVFQSNAGSLVDTMLGAIPKILIGIIFLSPCVLGDWDFTKSGTRGETNPFKLPLHTPKKYRIVNGVRASDNYRKGTAQVMLFDNEFLVF